MTNEIDTTDPLLDFSPDDIVVGPNGQTLAQAAAAERTYSIDDGHSNQLTTGLPEKIARETAKRLANDRHESVWLYRDSEGAQAFETEEIHPDVTAETLTANQVLGLLAEAHAKNDTLTADLCTLALKSQDSDGTVISARATLADIINNNRA